MTPPAAAGLSAMDELPVDGSFSAEDLPVCACANSDDAGSRKMCAFTPHVRSILQRYLRRAIEFLEDLSPWLYLKVPVIRPSGDFG